MHRGFQFGALVGVVVGAVRSIPLAFRIYSPLANVDSWDVVIQFSQTKATSKQHSIAGEGGYDTHLELFK